MSTLFFSLLFLSAPIFWIIGIITTIRAIFGSKSSGTSRTQVLREILPDLKTALKNPKKLSELISQYEAETSSLVLPVEPSSTPSQLPAVKRDPILTMNTVEPASSVVKEDLNSLWSRWYQENTINLLLYIGAFLIVVSASVFVGLSWQSLSGELKSLFLNFLTLAFLGSGLYFYFVTPKLRNAGATFVAIAALLIPFNGLAWYNFVLRDLGFSFGGVWLATSLVSVVVYAFLASSIRNKFYTYIAGLGGLSFVESFVSVGNLPTDYYILGGIFSSFVFLTTAKLFEGRDENKEVFYEPLYFSSQIVMPASIVFGLSIALAENKLFTTTTTLAGFFASAFYYFSYLLSNEINFLGVAQILTSFTVGVGAKAFHASNQTVGYLILTTSFIHVGLGLFLRSVKKLKEMEQAFNIGLITASFGFVLLLIFPGIPKIHLAILSLGLATLYLTVSLLMKNPVLINGFWSLVGLAGFFWFETTGKEQFFFSYLLLILGAASFATAISLWKSHKDFAQNLLLGTVAYLAFAYFFALPDTTALLAANFTIAALALLGSFFLLEPALIYGFWLFLGIGSFVAYNDYFNLSDRLQYFALVLTGLSVGFYVAAIELWKDRKAFALPLLTGTVVYLAFAHTFSFTEPDIFLLANVAAASIALTGTYFFDAKDLSYVANAFLYMSLWTLMRLFDVDLNYYPFVFCAGSLAFYAASFLSMDEHYKEHARNTALAVIGASPIFFASIAFGSISDQILERNALITAWIAVCLYVLEYYRNKKGSYAYLASAAFMFAFLWQEHYLGLTNIQYYAIPLSVYFLILSYIQRIGGKAELKDTFDAIGLFVLFVPTFVQSLEPSGGMYSLLQGIEGGIIFALGTSLSNRNYVYVGGGAIVVAVLLRTINFISTLPAWITIGAGGLIFLAVAVYLLATRKSGHTN